MNAGYRVEERGGLVEFHFFLPPERIGYARFILEGYDNLGIQTSAPGSSCVVWTVPACLRRDAETLLGQVMKDL